MERWRAASPRRWVDGSNRTNRINESNRLARPCSPVKPYIYSTYKLTSVLLLYCAHVHRFWQNKTDPANRQIWFVIQFTTSRLDDGDLKRLCHGRTKRFVPALAATKRNLNTIRFRGCLGVRHTLRHQPPPVSRSWSKTAVHKLGGSVRMLRPRTRPYPAVSTLVRNGHNACYILFVVRCGTGSEH